MVNRKVTVVAAPVHPVSTDSGSMGSVNAYTMASFTWIFPAVPPPFVLWTSEPAGAVLSTVTEPFDVEDKLTLSMAVTE